MAVVRTVDPRVSFSELEEWPDDGRRYELYDGEVIVVPAPLPRHQLVVLRISELLIDYAKPRADLVLFSPIDIVLTEYDVVQPDIVFFRRDRRALIDMMKAIRIPPDLAVEVLSRSTEVRDRGRKMDLLARFGVPEYWLVDPVRNTLEIYGLDGGGFRITQVYGTADLVQSATLPDLSFDTHRVFQD